MGDRSDQLSIRDYRVDDLAACRALWVELTEWHRQIYDSPQIGGPDPGRQFGQHLEWVGPENLWVAEEDAQVIGLAGLIRGGEDLELEPVVVSAAYRSRGIGRALVEAVLAAVGGESVVVRPVGRNAEAIRFFHALGFDVVSRVELLRHPGELWRAGERIGDRDFRV